MDLRNQYPDIKPGYHTNKVHWNTVEATAAIPDELMIRMIEDSYRLIVAGLKKSDREAIGT